MYKFFILLNILLISIALANNLKNEYNYANEEKCFNEEIPLVAEKWKELCSDWWDVDNADDGDGKDLNYPSFQICDCFEKKFVKTISEKNKRNLAALRCKYKDDWDEFYNSDEYKEFLKFGIKLWNLCDKEVPRFNE